MNDLPLVVPHHGGRRPPSKDVVVTISKDVDADPSLRSGRLFVGMTVRGSDHESELLAAGIRTGGISRAESPA
jgi:hypothetical protein